MRIDPDFDRRRPASDGQAFVYVLPLCIEDVLKLGFSRDPLARMQTLHRRWFELFDLERACLVECERVRDARAIETAAKRLLRAQRALVPPDIRGGAGGDSEWYRGAGDALRARVDELAAAGHVVHRGLAPWLATRLAARAGELYEWSAQALAEMRLARGADELAARDAIAQALRDALDAYVALGLDPHAVVAADVSDWYAGAAALPA